MRSSSTTLAIAIAEISHEPNPFNIHPTDIQDFAARYLLDGPTAMATRGSNNTELAGVLDVGRLHGWKITHTISAAAGPGGRVTDRAQVRRWPDPDHRHGSIGWSPGVYWQWPDPEWPATQLRCNRRSAGSGHRHPDRHDCPAAT